MSNAQSKRGILDLICTAVEICMPNLRHYYRMPKKGKIVATYPSANGEYFADVQILRNDETEDPDEPVISEVEIPILWAGPQRGVVCPPKVGTYCVVSYFDGNPAYPFISHFRWHEMDAPEAALEEFVIQLEPGVEIRIDKEKQIVSLTPSNWIVAIGGDAKVTAGGNVEVEALGGHADITGATEINLTAPVIFQNGRVTTRGKKTGGKTTVQEDANREQDGWCKITGDLEIGGNLIVAGNSSVSGNSHAGSRSGGSCPHN